MKMFWELAAGLITFLSQIAIRIFSTPVNSVASEHAFSVQNLIHTKICDRLHSAQADKLVYMYTNSWILSKFDGQLDVEGFFSKNANDLISKEEVILEDILLKIETQDTASKIGDNDKDDKEVDNEEDENVEFD